MVGITLMHKSGQGVCELVCLLPTSSLLLSKFLVGLLSVHFLWNTLVLNSTQRQEPALPRRKEVSVLTQWVQWGSPKILKQLE